jgi:acetyl esterase/lipase
LPASLNGEACHEFWLGTKFTAENAARFEAAGILPYVDSSSASRFQIMHGSRDPQVDVVHSVKLAEALRKVGIRPILHLNEGWPHGFSGPLPAEGMTSDFLLRSLDVRTSPATLLSSIRIQSGRTDSRDPAALPDFFQLDQHAAPKMPGTTLLYEGCAGKAIAGAPWGWSPI